MIVSRLSYCDSPDIRNHLRSVIASKRIPENSGSIMYLQIASFLPMTDLRNMFIFRYFNISAKVANSLSVICTLCPINWVETRNDDTYGNSTNTT